MSEQEEQRELRRIRVVLDPPRTHRGTFNPHPTDYLDFTVDFTSKFQYDFFYDLVRDRIAMIERWEDGAQTIGPWGAIPHSHEGPQCECVCHSQPLIIHDHACCSACIACGFRDPCKCERCGSSK